MPDITGTWSLIRGTSTSADGAEMPAPYGGDSAKGLVELTKDGRLLCVLVNSATDLPAGEKREFVSYCGSYTFDGTHMRTQVDASSRDAWFGTEQIREVSFEGETLVLRPPLRAYDAQPENRVLYWRKIA